MEGNKDRLEKFIKQNRDGFDGKEPGDELWNKIEEKLPASGGKARMYWYAAAMIVVLLGVGWILNNMLEQESQAPIQCEAKVALHSVSQEMAEVELYYATTLVGKMQEVHELGIEEEYLAEVRVLESEYEALKGDLCENMDKDRVVEAMILNYEMRIKILDNILRQVKS